MNGRSTLESCIGAILLSVVVCLSPSEARAQEDVAQWLLLDNHWYAPGEWEESLGGNFYGIVLNEFEGKYIIGFSDETDAQLYLDDYVAEQGGSESLLGWGSPRGAMYVDPGETGCNSIFTIWDGNLTDNFQCGGFNDNISSLGTDCYTRAKLFHDLTWSGFWIAFGYCSHVSALPPGYDNQATSLQVDSP